MQKLEAENATLLLGVTLPVVGWIAGTYAGHVPLSPFPHAITNAFHATPRDPFILAGLVAGLGLAASAAYLLRAYGDDGYRGAPYRRWLRGSRMANWHSVKAKVKAANRQENARRKKEGKAPLAPIMIGALPMPLHLENRNTMICASVGSGKSVTMEGMIASAIGRRDKMAIIDPNGTFYSKFSFPGDILLNGFDARSVGWSLFNEIKGVHDYDSVAKSVIPPQIDASEEQWCAYSRDVLADTMRKLHEIGNPDQDTLVNLLVREDGDVIKAFLANTDSQGYFRENAEKAVASIQFMLNKYVRPLRFMSKGDFSIHEWVHNPDAGNLFITWREDMRSTQKPLVATWIDSICRTILSYEPLSATVDTRLWLFLDELESLGKLESFVSAATKGRKHGLRIVGSIQDWAQLDENYGKDATKTLLSCFRNYIIFGASNALNADKASEILGKQHVERLQLTTTAHGASRNIVASAPEPVVLDSEVSNLNDLTGYVLFAEDNPIAKITVPYRAYPQRAVGIVLKGSA
ncbi:type IV secretion system DNA-binding domain-containing protein [Glaciimonas sp. CA11.2]|uniref:type IV secretion system DNA-binding domain-containing protein n=1 Tax=Glaciimonas sp. CA11.2 TaxID=3048601 RepID=UPI002AB386C9|nr:type IV secretion system DNA-binding domain-containing protein [Glaciimonas sp. CA11.2]MDY7549191.1 type IV secretion system DNA-binding domain-containing protein [Glaciimonas sp. CA11.2]MEB0161512.1 type IV secretion system DNA-binding domain-containing protein [Glaciimonas sp. CA11.2]